MAFPRSKGQSFKALREMLAFPRAPGKAPLPGSGESIEAPGAEAGTEQELPAFVQETRCAQGDLHCTHPLLRLPPSPSLQQAGLERFTPALRNSSMLSSEISGQSHPHSGRRTAPLQKADQVFSRCGCTWPAGLPASAYRRSHPEGLKDPYWCGPAQLGTPRVWTIQGRSLFPPTTKSDSTPTAWGFPEV